jgi:hypothetical protein
MSYIGHKVKRFIQRRAIATCKKIEVNQYSQRSDYEKKALRICSELIKSDGTKLLGNFVTQERYIKNKDLEMYIVVKENVIEIINHTYYYLVPISGKTYNIICNMFDAHQDSDRKEMDTEIRSNVTHSLETIYENVKNKIK